MRPCHGVTGMGDGSQADELPNPAAVFASEQLNREAVLADWFDLVTHGDLERFMPPFQSLTDRERWDVVAYAFMLGVSADALEKGEALYKTDCANCHGDRWSGQWRGCIQSEWQTNQFHQSSLHVAEYKPGFLHGDQSRR